MTRTSEKPSGEGVPGLTLSSRPLLCVGMLLASPGSSLHLHHGLGSAPACPLGKGVNCLCPPFPLTPVLRGAIPPGFFEPGPGCFFCADAKLLLLLLLQDALIHPHGGLTPRLAFFSWLLIVLVVLVWAGALRGMLRWPPIPGPEWGVGYAGTPGSLPGCEGGWMGFRAAKQGGCPGSPILGRSECPLWAHLQGRGVQWKETGMQVLGMLTCPSPMFHWGLL